ncbi:MAG: MATE family efflux transporter [Lachnospiraceae bacterium]|nr:MATE family efflux transporter [Lachnospiraceae bacterium]
MKSKKETHMTEGSIIKPILSFFFPILIGVFFQQLYNTVDAAVVGRFAGKAALASVGGSSGQILGFIFSFFMGLSTGATVIIAQYFGANKEKKVDTALHTAYTFALIGGLFLGTLGVIFTTPLLKLLNTPDDIMSTSTIYCKILLGGLVFTLIYNIGSGILRAVGDSKRPLYILIACCVVNTILDVLFVGVLKMGVLGAAIATDVSQAFSAFLVTLLLMKHTTQMKLNLKKLHIDGPTIKRIIKIGLPTALAGSMFSVSNMIVQSTINNMGIDTVAAWTAYGKVDVLWWMMNQAYSTSITTFVGQNYGARKPDRIRTGTRSVLLMEMATGAILSLLFINFGSIVLQLFTSDKDVIAIAITLAKMLTPFYAVFAIGEILGATLRAENYVLFSTVTNLVGICAFRIIWVKLINPSGTFRQVMMCYPISWVIITAIVTTYYFIMQDKILKKITPKTT